MITTRELNYVSSWASKAPYPGMKYAEQATEKLFDAVGNYDKFYANKMYDIILSNGEQMSFEILSKNLCHMLGIDYKNLASDYFESFREDVLELTGPVKSYDLLKAILNKVEDILKYDYENGGKILNYYRIMVKCAIFDKLSDFSRFNFGVINFESDKYASEVGSIYKGNTKKIFYVQSNEAVAPYFMMGVLPSGDPTDLEYNPDKYAVETLIAPTNPKSFFSGQEVVIPTQILTITEENMIKTEATASEKLALLNQYKSIINNYNLKSKLNISGDYENILAAASIEEHKTRTRKIS